MPPELLGPFALTAALLIAVGVLWRDHQKADARRDELLDVAVAGWKAQTDASESSASSIEQISQLLRERRASERSKPRGT